MTSYEFTSSNKDLFKQIAARLEAAGAGLNFNSIFNAEDKSFTYTDMPYVGSGCYDRGEGFYFKARGNYFGLSDQDLFAMFPMSIDGFDIKMVSFFDFDYDDDRTWPESIGFVISKDGKNVLESFSEAVAS